MKRIGLFLDVRPHAGGMFQYSQTILDAVAALPPREYEKIVVYTDPQWVPILERNGLPHKMVPIGVLNRLLSNIWRVLPLPVGLWRRVAPCFHPVARVLSRERCDLWIFPAQDIWSYMAPVPALTTIHDLMHRYERRFPEVSARGRFYLRERRFRNIGRWSKGIVVDSQIGKQQVGECYGTPASRIFVLPYIAPGHITKAAPPGAKPEDYELPEKYLFYPAQFWEHKNHRLLVQALAAARNEYPDIALVLVGSKKNAYPGVMKEVHRLGLRDCVHVIGYVPDHDLPDLYRRARALVMPTFFGPTNIPPLEAFALGCPVAVSDIYGMREQLGDAAMYFNPVSVENIGDVIKRLWSDDALCKRLSEQGIDRAAHWTAEHFNRAYERIVQANLA